MSNDPTQDPTQDAPQDANDTTAAVEPQDELEALRAEVEQLKAQSLIERADLENQRKRLARDIEMARKFANERLLSDLLPVFDSLDAGLAAAGADAGALRQGMELTYKQLLKVAADNGMEVLDPTGQPFDPEHHQAISQGEAEGVAPGHVINVFQKGYRLNGRLLRPALVIVARND
ncbi:nucleotide exchange factor GrpE [Thermomonas haemolytica]|uniref:Protein GrpE n=1 Tax=Thermomonas haemolytica TaxID=141949 RepID=A0A4R3N390_9GAMM|nr:nucleotide exchange factor GrpE [Thermomonas haemolytica]TCT23204.1 molecular chaperone GrpE [Thermomonas haemolytica]TNY29565.1 nucleotide exchange factor GrpE [Thermomonas haemolytica]